MGTSTICLHSIKSSLPFSLPLRHSRDKLSQALSHFSILQVMESWAGPGNEARFQSCMYSAFHRFLHKLFLHKLFLHKLFLHKLFVLNREVLSACKQLVSQTVQLKQCGTSVLYPVETRFVCKQFQLHCSWFHKKFSKKTLLCTYQQAQARPKPYNYPYYSLRLSPNRTTKAVWHINSVSCWDLCCLLWWFYR